MIMKNTLGRELRAELIEVDQVFKEKLLPCWGEINRYIKILEDDPTWHQLPPLIYMAYKSLGLDRKISVSMTNIFKTIYLANSIHSLIKDDEEGQKHDQELQFSILIGDYIFGRMLKLLVEAGADNLVGHFAIMMAEINEGQIMKWKLGVGQREVLRKTHGSIYATAFETAGCLSGMSDIFLGNYRQLGLNLGMAMELINCNILRQEALVHIHQAKGNYKVLNQHRLIENNNWGLVINEICLLLSDNLGKTAVM